MAKLAINTKYGTLMLYKSKCNDKYVNVMQTALIQNALKTPKTEK